MDQRERYLRTLKFQPADRIPLVEWPLRAATRSAWEKQGYPQNMSLESFFGLDQYSLGIPINLGMLPVYSKRTISRDGAYKIWIDETGARRKDFADQASPGFVTRSWLRFPVEDRNGFCRMRRRYAADDSARYPDNWREMAPVLNHSKVVTHLSVPGLFWTVRDWMGFENICLAFHDQKSLLQEMFEYLTDFYIATLQIGIDLVKIDLVELKEDMAYKGAAMISPEQFRVFMAPCYRKLVDFFRSKGVDIIFVDCDGYPEALIPGWLENGIDGMSPAEVAAGCDVVALRKKYPQLVLWGGMDKRVLAADKRAVYEEVAGKMSFMLAKGGYIPHIDHAIPADARLENYIYYRSLLNDMAYGRPVAHP